MIDQLIYSRSQSLSEAQPRRPQNRGAPMRQGFTGALGGGLEDDPGSGTPSCGKLGWSHLSCPSTSRMLWLTWTLLSTLVATASGNTAPRFEMSSVFSLPEDTRVGAWVFQLVAVDADGDKLYYSIEGDNAYYFSVNHETGNVTLRQKLNYKQTKKILVEAGVTDNINVMVKKKITIVVEDRNDNKPVFQNEPYFTDVLENTAIGSPIFRVEALDEDSGNAGRVSYRIEEVNPNDAENHNLFYILYNGTVVLNGSLSYNNKSTFYRIKIFATDNGGLLDNVFIYQNNTAYLSVTVVDVADLDPQFLGEPFTGSVPEHCPLGTTVTKVFAIDGDKDVNDVIYYSITNDTSLFIIDNITGVITVSGILDREGVPGEDVDLQVVAREKNLNIYHQVAQVSTMVTIQITDINDNTPQFYLCIYLACNFSAPPESNFSGQIEEHTSARTPVANLTIVAYDPDKGANGTFQLTLQGPDASAFSVSPQQIVNEGAVQVLVSNPSLVDYEKTHTMTVEIVANDTGKTIDCCSFATVTIQLIDTNDHRPEFEKNDYKLSVLEKSPPGTVVSSNITATDPDSGLFGEITYQLLPPSIRTTFTVNATTGTVLVANGSNLDWRFRPIYYATLQATDGGNLTGFTQLEIYVIDINDNPPVVVGSYIVFVTEGKKMEPVQILATDQDDPETDNSRRQFKLLPSQFSNNFTINADTGELSSDGPLDREAIPADLEGKIVVTVLVHDMGTPQLSTTVNVTIVVEDINDNAPMFNSTLYEFFIREGLKGPVGSVEATDADQTEINNRISFYLATSASSNNFVIRSIYLGPGWYQGLLSLAIALDYDQMPQKFLSLTVQAENLESGGTADADNATVIVNVLDVNDEPPTLVPSPPHDIKVLENAPLHELVTQLEATDVDTIHSLVFEKLAVACLKSSEKVDNVCQNWFRLDSNGSLFVNSSKINYIACDQVELTLRVKDEFTEEGNPYSKNETLRIQIIDVNDNPPVIDSITGPSVLIPGVFPVGFPVAVVTATDADSGPNSVITFTVSRVVFIQDNVPEQNYQHLFKAVTTGDNGRYTGSIQISSSPPSTLKKGHFQVTVEAKDNGTHPLNSSLSLNISIVDPSKFIKLEFNAPLANVEANSSKIQESLMRATNATVYIAGFKEMLSASRADRTVMEVYFFYSNGTTLDYELVTRLIENNPKELPLLLSFHLSLIGPVQVTEPNTMNELFGIIAGLAGAVLLLLVITILTIIGMRKSYKRKLKALKALKVASKFSVNVVQQGPGIPGTNQYNWEKANPVLGFALDAAMDLGFEDNPSFEVASLNSLDENMVDAPETGLTTTAVKVSRTGAQNQAYDREEPLKAAIENHNKDKQWDWGGHKVSSSLDTTDV